ncbi:MAG: hypothetical protein ABSB15_24445 [Bryobacteraceae bacterium]
MDHEEDGAICQEAPARAAEEDYASDQRGYGECQHSGEEVFQADHRLWA